MAITTQPHYFHNGFPALSSPPPRPPSSTPLSYHLLKCINSSEINSLLYDAVSANVMIFVQKMGESESGFSFAFGSQPFQFKNRAPSGVSQTLDKVKYSHIGRVIVLLALTRSLFELLT